MNALYIFLKRNVLYLTITSLWYVVKFYIFLLTFFSAFLLFLGFIKVEINELFPSFVQKKKTEIKIVGEILLETKTYIRKNVSLSLSIYIYIYIYI